MNFYILIFLTAFFASMTILTTIQIVYGETKFYEDQIVICFKEVWQESGNMGLACKIYQWDENTDIAKVYNNNSIWNEFKNEIDTFSVKVIE